ncbi:restriction endonuclease subunit S [Escherichia coli]|uniref:restriction endonuclease subunit S n=1 Tax=Escherichia coli TaxID=562 RepID=UPI0015CAC84A|nr:restriction endonuclease subunit S [Escherichia coli]
MSELSYLEKLLDGVEVEWKTLEDISIKISSGGTPKTGVSEFYDGDIPWLRTQEVNFCDIWDTEVKITESGVKNSSAKWIPKNCVIVAMYGATVGKIGINKIPMTTNQACANIQLNEEVAHYRYVFHFLCSQYTYIKSLGTGSQTNINAQIVKNIKIPIPCPENPEKSLAIQSEIVRILDKFTALTAELTAELNMRKKQYNYYRDQLLSFKDGEVEWKTLGDVTKKWYSGGTPTAGKIEYYENGNIPWLRTQEVKFSEIDSTEIKITQAALKNSSAKWIPRNCVIIAISGATAGRSAINKIPLTTNQHCGCLEIDDTKALYRYVFHWVSFNYENIKSLGQGARGDLNSTIIKNFKLPIPYASDPQKSLKEQARIVEILNKFDTLTNSITEGLPREIELRQKQYEYYRDLLFSFPKPETASN